MKKILASQTALVVFLVAALVLAAVAGLYLHGQQADFQFFENAGGAIAQNLVQIHASIMDLSDSIVEWVNG